MVKPGRKYSFCALATCLSLTLLFSVTGAVWAGPEDSVRTDVAAMVTNEFVYQPDTNLQVNEGEIRAGLLYDAVNQKIVWEKNMSSSYPIASLTKMMVALLAVEDVRAGKYRWEDRVQWTRETVVGRRKHRRIVRTIVNYSLYDVFKASMIASNNECADQMARFLGCGDLASSLRRMNEKAASLGMSNTWYGNPFSDRPTAARAGDAEVRRDPRSDRSGLCPDRQRQKQQRHPQPQRPDDPIHR